MADIIEIVYGDVKKKWNNGKYFQAIAQGYFAPYTELFNVIGNFFRTDSSLTDNDGVNIERIILAGEKANAKRLRVKIDKRELTGADAAIGKLKSKSNIKATIGKESESNYFIEVEYAQFANQFTVADAKGLSFVYGKGR